MEATELLKMTLPYIVSITVFFVIGVAFYIKDLIFNFLDRKRQAMWQCKYGVQQASAQKYRIKRRAS